MHARTLCPYSVIEIEGVKYHHHPNGGGLVAEGAEADPTAFIDVGVTVTEHARVLGNVRLEGHACVSGKAEVSGEVCVRDDVVISGESVVTGQVKLSDAVRICNHSRVEGDMWFSGHGLISHSHLSGHGRHHNPRMINVERELN